MHVCATFSSIGTRLQEKKIQKWNYQEIGYKVVTFHISMEVPLSNQLHGRLHICQGHQRNHSCQFWWLCVEGFGYCKGSILDYSKGS
jgi:hypothetical protein